MLAARALVVVLASSMLSACGAESPTAPADLPRAEAMIASSHAATPCQDFRATGTTMGISPNAFQGQASVQIGDGDAVVATVTTTLTGSVKQGTLARGAQVVTTSHSFDFGGGDTFVTEDIARLVPTQTPGVFKLLSTLHIVSGTGAFAHVASNPNPRIVGHAQTSVMNLSVLPPVATWSLDTRICGYHG